MSLLLPALSALAAACNQAPSATTSPATASQASPAAQAPASNVFGAAITSSNTVMLADLAREPQKWQGQPVVITGTVADVCQHMGCWMVIEDGASKARVRMHDHSFFVPKDCKGRKARVQGQVVVSANPKPSGACNHEHKPGEQHECPKDQPGELSFDATGVQLL